MLEYDVMTILMEAAGGFGGYIETLNHGLAMINWRNTRLFEYQVLKDFHILNS